MQAEIYKLNDYSIPLSERCMVVEKLYYNYIDDFSIGSDVYDYNKYIEHIKNLPVRKPRNHSQFFNIDYVKSRYEVTYINNVSQFNSPTLNLDVLNKKESKNKYKLEDFGSLQIYNEQNNTPQSVLAHNSLGICILIPYKYKTDSLAAKKATNLLEEEAYAIALRNYIEIRNNKIFIENSCTYYLLVIKKTYVFPIPITTDHDIFMRSCLQIKMYIFGISSRDDDCFGISSSRDEDSCVSRISYGCYKYDYKTPYTIYTGEYESKFVDYVRSIPCINTITPYEYTRWCEVMTEIKIVLEQE